MKIIFVTLVGLFPFCATAQSITDDTIQSFKCTNLSKGIVVEFQNGQIQVSKLDKLIASTMVAKLSYSQTVTRIPDLRSHSFEFESLEQGSLAVVLRTVLRSTLRIVTPTARDTGIFHSGVLRLTSGVNNTEVVNLDRCNLNLWPRNP
jgi:hypothetical protein